MLNDVTYKITCNKSIRYLKLYIYWQYHTALSDALVLTIFSAVVTDRPVATVDSLSTFFTIRVVEPVGRTAHVGLRPIVPAVPVPGQDNVSLGLGQCTTILSAVGDVGNFPNEVGFLAWGFAF